MDQHRWVQVQSLETDWNLTGNHTILHKPLRTISSGLILFQLGMTVGHLPMNIAKLTLGCVGERYLGFPVKRGRLKERDWWVFLSIQIKLNDEDITARDKTFGTFLRPAFQMIHQLFFLFIV